MYVCMKSVSYSEMYLNAGIQKFMHSCIKSSMNLHKFNFINLHVHV